MLRPAASAATRRGVSAAAATAAPSSAVLRRGFAAAAASSSATLSATPSSVVAASSAAASAALRRPVAPVAAAASAELRRRAAVMPQRQLLWRTSPVALPPPPAADDGGEAKAAAAEGAAAEGAEAAEGSEEGAAAATEGEGEGEAAEGGEAAAAAAVDLEAEVARLQVEVLELNKKLLLAVAETENQRKTGQRDVQAARQFGVTGFAKDILETQDNLERALRATAQSVGLDPEAVSGAAEVTDAQLAEAFGDNHVARELFEGLKMTESALLAQLSRNHVTRSYPLGEVFDPNTMNALVHIPFPDKEPGTVGTVMAPGYFIHKRVLRAADVGVVAEPVPAVKED